MKLVPESSPKLKQVARPVERKELIEVFKKLEQLRKLVTERGAVGAAANQIGDCRRFIVCMKTLMINPEIVSKGTAEDTMWEGCLSYPYRQASVTRAVTVTVRYRNMRWEEETVTLEGFPARVLQHELDHLDGICKVGEAPDTRTQSISTRGVPAEATNIGGGNGSLV